jgi:hypothetical protein
MVEVVKDERKVVVEGDFAIFTYENVQKYTLEQAKNVYVSIFHELKDKEKYLGQFADMKKQTHENVVKQLDAMVVQLRNMNPNLDAVKIKHWKDIQIMQSEAEVNARFKQMEQDVEHLKEGLLIWAPCRDLPETDHERKLKEKFEKQQK